MSFSHEIKEELTRVVPVPRHCLLAELAALISMNGRVATSLSGHLYIRLQAENAAVIEKTRILIHKSFD